MADERWRIEVSGDTAVDVHTPSGKNYSIRWVGIGHPWHTISDGRGREATGAEYALARALIARINGPDKEDEDWRCECGDLNRLHEWSCYRCGAGRPEEGDS